MPDVTLPPNGRATGPLLPAPERARPFNAAPAQPMPVDTIGPGLPQVPDLLDALREQRTLTEQVPDDLALEGGLFAMRDGRPVELTRYQQVGKVHIAGDTVTQDIGRGKSADYSLAQLAARSKDAEYFEATMRYAAKHGESVTIDVHSGVTRVVDPTLERSLPQDLPLRDPILRAALMHDIDPKLLAAVGVQETHLGADYLGPSIGYNKTTHRGDLEADSPGGHGYGPFQYDDQKRPGDRPRPQLELDRIARDPYYAADKAASMLSGNLQRTRGNVSEALHLYNAGSLGTPSTTTDWGPSIGHLPYEDSAMRYYGEIASRARAQDLGHAR